MSNRIRIQRCEFINYPNRDVTYGFRAYDDYDQTYANTCTIEQMTTEPIEFLKWLGQSAEDSRLLEMLDFAKEAQSGLYIDDAWYDWDEIRHVLEPDCGDPQSTSGTGSSTPTAKDPTRP